MVLQADSAASLWPIFWSPKHLESDKGVADDTWWDQDRGFEIADSVEKGLAREVGDEFIHPLRKSRRLWRFNVVRSQDRLSYRLFADTGEFLMYAQVSLETHSVGFFLYEPSDELYSPERPAFTMSFNDNRTEWKVVKERCEHCQFSPKHASCACHGKQQIAFMRHSTKVIGGGVSNCMEVHIPGLYSDGSRVVWCPLLGRGDLADPLDDGYHVQRLINKDPVWHDDAESLVLDFAPGRIPCASAKNFQLALEQKPAHIICQFTKIGSMTFALDFRYPFSIIQAFSASLTTLFWA